MQLNIFFSSKLFSKTRFFLVSGSHRMIHLCDLFTNLLHFVLISDKFETRHSGAVFDYFHNFNSNDFTLRHDLAPYPKAPYIFETAAGKFEFFRNLWFTHLARGRALFVAPESGKYTFYLVCKTRCQLDISEVGFSVYVFGTKTVGADIGTNNYKTYVDFIFFIF